MGRPIGHNRLYVLTPHLMPLPAGVPGEVFVGVGGAAGYLNQGGLTAADFVPDLLTGDPGARLYRTGDWARYLPGGDIELLAHNDQEVRISGAALLLVEIEAILRQHPGVREAVAAPTDDASGSNTITAYVLRSPELVSTPDQLLRFLRERLFPRPVPVTCVLVDALPRSPDGRLDRDRLPAVNSVAAEREGSADGPRDAIELQLLDVWENLFNTRPLGIRDNFFDLGGHSVLAVRLMTQIQKLFGKDLPLSTLFQHATIEHLASVIRQRDSAAGWSPLVAIQPLGRKRPFFCVHPVGGGVLCYADLARYLGRDRPFYGLQAAGLDGSREPFTRIEEMAACYVEAIRKVQPEGPYLLGGWSFGGAVAFEIARQLAEQGERIACLCLLDTNAPDADDEPAAGEADSNPGDDSQEVAALLVGLAGMFNLPVALDELQQMGPEEQLSHILRQAREAGRLPPEVGLPQLRRILLISKSNRQAALSYRPQMYCNKITIFRADQEEVSPLTPADAGTASDPTSGWSRLSPHPVEIHFVPGNHGTFVYEPHVRVLAERMAACFDQAEADR